MAKEKNKKTHNIYLIDSAKALQKSNLISASVDEIITYLMSVDQNYKLQRLKPDLNTSGFNVALYFRKEEQYHSKFASFCNTFVDGGQDAVNFFPRSSSSVLFIWNNNNNIFAVTTGQGFRIIENYTVPKFGLIVASAFYHRFRITSLDSNAMSSIVHSTKTVYSNEVDFIDIDALDTIFKEITGRLNDANSVHSLLNLKPQSKRNSVKLTAKNYVQFSSSLNFDGLIHLLGVISQLDFNALNDRFNLIVPITHKNNKDIITRNSAAIIQSMYSALNSNQPFPFDLFHKDTNAYIEADSYCIYNPDDMTEYAILDDSEALLLLKSAYTAFLSGNPDTEAAFFSFTTSVRLRTHKGDYVQTDGTLLQHLSGEICVDGKNYYMFYGEYYYLTETYNERLKESLSGKLRKEFFTSEIKTPWLAGEKEDDFNLNVSLKEGYVHLHKIKPDYIEFCDLLKFDGKTLSIVHVKDGFDGDMRVLDRQVELSISKIMDLKHYNNGDYMRTLYRNASRSETGVNIATVFPTEESFLETMKNMPVRYIIAVRPTNTNLIESKSNIAKHCLNAMILRCFNQGFPLNIQIL